MTNTTRRKTGKTRALRAIVPVIVAVGTLGVLATVQAQSAQAADLAAVNSLMSRAQSDAAALNEPIKYCITRGAGSKDARSPLFNRCIDWHSAVHGHASLYTLARVTKNSAYAEPAEQRLASGNLSGELQYMRTTTTNRGADNPYGFAWFLRLAAERERVNGQTTLRPLADYAANQLTTFRSGVSVRGTNYYNMSWAVLNLADWANFTKNSSLLATARSQAEQLKSSSCDVQNDTGSATEFIPPCLMRVAAVATVEGPSSAAWVNSQIPTGFNVPFLPNTGTDHSMGQNFYRAFALARIGNMTGRADILNNAARLAQTQLDNKTVWTTNYSSWSHWVAQVGVLAQQEVLAPITSHRTAVSSTPPSVAPAAAGTAVKTNTGTATGTTTGTSASTGTQTGTATGTTTGSGTTSTKTGTVTSSGSTSGITKTYSTSGTVSSGVVPRDQLPAAQQQVNQQIEAAKKAAQAELQAKLDAEAQRWRGTNGTVTTTQQQQPQQQQQQQQPQRPAAGSGTQARPMTDDVEGFDDMDDEGMDDDDMGMGTTSSMGGMSGMGGLPGMGGGGAMDANSIWQKIMSWFQSWSM